MPAALRNLSQTVYLISTFKLPFFTGRDKHLRRQHCPRTHCIRTFPQTTFQASAKYNMENSPFLRRVDMLNYRFYSEQDGREPAAERRRTSFSTDSFITRCITKSPICLIPVCFVFHKAITKASSPKSHD
ncbi:hypothetical protein CY34DRAFT_652512 [Suillus luteus UH-Slu-Lm8-n1]|uniref:Uncharacterized protein n=1 Tax=Suillus luteus UH-Slu-Lm8-n1 TaxID=930992 RepID=A0A0C9Z9R6_9AGAM|nr:hypothetical protein CY34DRAFT_652512 [Suillus luteus UH-Slu-Lm8-n1]